MTELAVTPVRHGPFPGHLVPADIAAYAAATGDRTPAMLDGVAVPPVFPVIAVFTPQEAARADAPEAAWRHVRGGVHGEHDIVLRRPLVPGERLDTWSQISAVRTHAGGHSCRGAVGPGRRRWQGRRRAVVDDGVARSARRRRPRHDACRAPVRRRCAVPSDRVRQPPSRQGHGTPLRGSVRGLGRAPLRVEVARAAGFGFVFAHGLCTMAICTHRVLGMIGVNHPGRVRRVAARFASPTPLGCELTVNAYGIKGNSFAFEAAVDGSTTITNGRLELRP